MTSPNSTIQMHHSIAEIFKISEKSIKQKLYLYKKKIGVEGESLSLRKFIENF